jgi:hypothetical protein
MFKLLKRLKDWRSERIDPSPERWEQIREKGRARYVFHQALILAVTVSVGTDFVNCIWNIHSSIRSTILTYSIAGFISGCVAWSKHENKYHKALASRRRLFGDNKIVLH